MIPKVSICIPTYNQTVYLKKVLDSIFEQSFTDYEVVISDDSTTDQVKNLLDKYSEKTQKIRYYHHSSGLGSPENWNFVVRKARGEFIKIMHHDDWFISKDSLQKYVDATIGIHKPLIFSAAQAIRNHSIQIHKPKPEIVKVFQENPLELILGNLIGGPSSIMYPNLNEYSFDKNLKWLVDIDFYILLLKNNYRLIYIEEILYVSIIDEHNITNSCLNNDSLNLYEYTQLLVKHTYQESWWVKQKYFFKIFKILKNNNNIGLIAYYKYVKRLKTYDKQR